MKFLLVILLAFVACSKKTDITRESSTADTTAPPKLVSPWSECEEMRGSVIKLIESRVPEIQEIGVPYVKRISEGKGQFSYTLLRCPLESAADTLMRNYYSIGGGYGDGDMPLLWYDFYVGKDMRTILVKEYHPYQEPHSTLKPLDSARASAGWKGDWEGRR